MFCEVHKFVCVWVFNAMQTKQRPKAYNSQLTYRFAFEDHLLGNFGAQKAKPRIAKMDIGNHGRACAEESEQ